MYILYAILILITMGSSYMWGRCDEQDKWIKRNRSMERTKLTNTGLTILRNIVINEAHRIHAVTIHEKQDDTIIIKSSGEDNVNEMVKHIKAFNRPSH